MNVIFTEQANKDFHYWKKVNPQIYQRIVKLLKDISIEPFTGLGKPEGLKGNLSGFWSRRIDRAHKLVYKVAPGVITVISCRFHYT